jgi:hypothetical protein
VTEDDISKIIGARTNYCEDNATTVAVRVVGGGCSCSRMPRSTNATRRERRTGRWRYDGSHSPILEEAGPNAIF